MSDYKNDMDGSNPSKINLYPSKNALCAFYPSKRRVDGSVDESMWYRSATVHVKEMELMVQVSHSSCKGDGVDDSGQPQFM